MGSCVYTSVGWEGVNRYPLILNKSLIANQKKKFISVGLVCQGVYWKINTDSQLGKI